MPDSAGSITLYRIAGTDANAKDAASAESGTPRSATEAPTGGKQRQLKGFQVGDEIGDVLRVVLAGEGRHAVPTLFNLGGDDRG